jgi:hypothetical protein
VELEDAGLAQRRDAAVGAADPVRTFRCIECRGAVRRPRTFDRCEICTLVGTHGAGPSWRSEADGSSVVGAAVASVDPPDKRTAIPWVLLTAVSHTGTGEMSDVIAVQRVDTRGGMAPTSGCDAAHVGTETSAAYTATYYFYKGGQRDAAGAASHGD